VLDTSNKHAFVAKNSLRIAPFHDVFKNLYFDKYTGQTIKF